MNVSRGRHSDRLLEVLRPYRQVFIVTHDNPDPDAIATGWSIHWLVQSRLAKKVRLLGGGSILRAENRHLVKLLDPPIELVSRLRRGDDTAVVLVDCQSGNQNHIFCRENVEPVAVVDHHEIRTPVRNNLAYCDIRPHVAASATIAASYLREQNLEPGQRLATAMFCAIRTETRGSETSYSRLDRSVLLWLAARTNLSQVAEIESAPLRLEYYGDLILGLQNAFLYGRTAICLLPRASGPEIIGEMADLLIRCEAIDQVLCAAMVHSDLLLSSRTKHDRDDAAELIRITLEGIGQSGGHRRRAGGKIPNAGHGSKPASGFQELLCSRWLAVCGATHERRTRLVARREIMENLP